MLVILARLVLSQLDRRLLHSRPTGSGGFNALMNGHGKGRRSRCMACVAGIVGDAALSWAGWKFQRDGVVVETSILRVAGHGRR